MVEYLFEPATFLRTQAWSRLPTGLIGCIAHKHNVTDEPLIFSASFEIKSPTGPTGNSSLKKYKATLKPEYEVFSISMTYAKAKTLFLLPLLYYWGGLVIH